MMHFLQRYGRFLMPTFIGLAMTIAPAQAQMSATDLTIPNLGKKEFRIITETAFSASTASQTPFWLRTNQYGMVPTASPFASLRGSLTADYVYDKSKPAHLIQGKRRLIGWGYGLDVVGNVGRKSAVLVPELYAKGHLWGLELLVGRRREVVGLADSTLGTGPLVWSGNALPLPKIQLSLPDYTPISFTKGVLSFRGLYAHGWFDNRSAVTHSYLHQKALYGRIGKTSWPVRFYGGFNHQVQWAGRSEVITNENQIKNGRFPSGFDNYLNAVFGTSLAAQGDNIDTTEFSKADRGNRVGNHLGSVDIGLEVKAKQFSLLLYRQSIFEDGSLFYLTNIADGLNGIRFQNRRPATHGLHVQTVVAEFLYTLSQGGAAFTENEKFRGNDNYFNHTQYIDGWSYQGQTLGTPFISPARLSRTDLPRPQTATFPSFSNNNRVKVFHVGLAGSLHERYIFQVKTSLSQNLGTYALPFPSGTWQFSTLLLVARPVSWWGSMQASVALAHDQGNLYPNNTGFRVSLRKNWDVTRPDR
ncbi:capsule assembly Wzi family protein [Larkinella sp. VNQ87]|uniref:capsule assembly Wzi family protein n=1 Tax=Larkinella sp. VNQ87 TaxID=3400921 RepID=UPI003C07BB7A